MKKLLQAAIVLAALAVGGWGYWLWSQPTPDFADVAYADRSERNVLDVYRAPQGSRPAPAIIVIHGGGFEMGSKGNPDGLEELRAAGFAVVAINYRYSSEAVWPAQRDDVADAIRHVRANAERYGIDPERLGVWGASAGGHLAATAGIMLANDPATRVQAVVDWFGPIDFALMDADMQASGNGGSQTLSADSPESRLIGASVSQQPERAARASPRVALAALGEAAILPPFLIMHGARDPLIAPRQSQRLAAAITARGGEADLVILPRGTHGGGDFAEPAATARVVAFFERTLQSTPTGL